MSHLAIKPSTLSISLRIKPKSWSRLAQPTLSSAIVTLPLIPFVPVILVSSSMSTWSTTDLRDSVVMVPSTSWSSPGHWVAPPLCHSTLLPDHLSTEPSTTTVFKLGPRHLHHCTSIYAPSCFISPWQLTSHDLLYILLTYFIVNAHLTSCKPREDTVFNCLLFVVSLALRTVPGT